MFSSAQEIVNLIADVQPSHLGQGGGTFFTNGISPALIEFRDRVACGEELTAEEEAFMDCSAELAVKFARLA